MPRTIHLLAGLTLVAPAVACYQGLDVEGAGASGEAGEDAGESADDGIDDGDGTYSCEAPELRGQGKISMRRLTRDELLQSMAAIVGDDVMAAPTVVEAAVLVPKESPLDLVADFQNGMAVEHAGGILATAEAVAAAIAANEARRDAIFGTCAATADSACAEAFLDAHALAILRRPLPADRRAALLAGFTGEGGGLPGMQTVLAQLLQAPEFVFHVEITTGEPDDGVVAVDDWSVAARLSYALTGQGPDAELLAAAGEGTLRTTDDVLPHAERLLATPAARRQLGAMLDSWLVLGAVPDANAPLLAMAGLEGEGLAREARDELVEYATHLVFDRDADATELLSAKLGFPRSERMATLYGTPIVTGDEPVALAGGHGGLLLRLAPLVSGHPHTSPILRGAYVRKRMLCDTLPAPDPAAVSAGLAQADAADRTTMSNREVVEQITSPGACSSCHQMVNPIGFTLESFDPLGRWRAEEIVYDDDGTEIARHPIDARVENPMIDEDGPTALDGAEALVSALAASTKVRGCLAERMVTQAQLRPAVEADACAIAEVQDALVEGESVRDAWIAAVVGPELFVRNAEGSP
jgi:hypothetical protein